MVGEYLGYPEGNKNAKLYRVENIDTMDILFLESGDGLEIIISENVPDNIYVCP
jgi:hypothetical protein